MPDTYTYKVRDRRGTLITGEIVGESQDLVLAKLREQRYIPLEVKAKSGGLKREFHLLPQKAKLKDLAVFSRQFATMVNSGLPLLRTLSILEDQTESKYLGKIVGEMRLDVEKGVSLSAAMAKHPRAFKDLYAQLGGTLPLPTRLLIALSDAVKSYFIFFILGIIVLAFLLRRWKNSEKGRLTWDKFKLRVPIFGPLFHKTAMARFARTLSVLNRSGVPILQSLDIVQETVSNAVVANAVKDLQAGVKEGESLATPLSRHPVFPAMVVQMMAVGEETGALDTMLEKVAIFYDEEVTAAVESLTSLIEPVMIAVVGGVVGAIVIALYLPTFKIFELIQ